MTRIRAASPQRPSTQTPSTQTPSTRAPSMRAASPRPEARAAPAGRSAFTARSAGELAWAAERLGVYGIVARQRGWCRGELLSRDLQLHPRGVIGADAGSGVRGALERRRRRRASNAHAVRGHEPGCRALGIPGSAFERLLLAWDGVGAGSLILEACDDAISELAAAEASGEAWQARDALEALSFALGRRVALRRPDFSYGSH